MGNFLTKKRNAIKEKELCNECIICWDPVDKSELVVCVQCKIIMHKKCEEMYKNNVEFSKCPHCQKVGGLGSLSNKNES